MKRVTKSWGSELWLVNNELYCAKILTCNRGKWSSGGRYHFHKDKDETFLILSGKLLLDIEGAFRIMEEKEKYRIPPGVKHRFKATSLVARVLEVSTHHDDRDSYRIP